MRVLMSHIAKKIRSRMSSGSSRGLVAKKRESESLTQTLLAFYDELNAINGHYSVILINKQWLSASTPA